MALRYFYKQMPDLHVIAAGSLLEFVFSEISFPVGRIQSLEVPPMNFSEFLLEQLRCKMKFVKPFNGISINSKVFEQSGNSNGSSCI